MSVWLAYFVNILKRIGRSFNLHSNQRAESHMSDITINISHGWNDISAEIILHVLTK